jgi:hypothetical protein
VKACRWGVALNRRQVEGLEQFAQLIKHRRWPFGTQAHPTPLAP